MNKFIWIVFAVFFLASCAAIKEGVNDYQVGKNAPLEQGEVSVKDKVEPIINTVSGIPVVGPFAGPLGIVLTGLFTYLRGRRIRKEIPSTDHPATGHVGLAIGAEAVIQNLSNVVAGLFEVGSDNSPIKRAWKVTLSSLLGLGTFALSNSDVQTFVLNHPGISSSIIALSGLFAGLEKALSNVKPLEKPIVLTKIV
jgi:hypothetical protein